MMVVKPNLDCNKMAIKAFALKLLNQESVPLYKSAAMFHEHACNCYKLAPDELQHKALKAHINDLKIVHIASTTTNRSRPKQK